MSHDAVMTSHTRYHGHRQLYNTPATSFRIGCHSLHNGPSLVSQETIHWLVHLWYKYRPQLCHLGCLGDPRLAAQVEVDGRFIACRLD